MPTYRSRRSGVDLRTMFPPQADDEPEAICANCDSFDANVGGVSMCRQKGGGFGSPEPTDTCGKFFPDGTRWPDADHGDD